MLALLLGVGNLWGQSITFDFEDDGAHTTESSNSFTNHTYYENEVSIVLSYAESTNTGSPLNGGWHVVGRVAKNTTNSPTVILGPINNNDYKVTGISYKTKANSTTTGISVTYSTDNTNWTNVSSLGIGTIDNNSITTKSVDNLAIEGDKLYVKFVISGGTSTKTHRDVYLDDIIITRETIGGDTPTKTDIATLTSISPTELTVGDNGNFTLGAAYANDAYSISWASDDANVLDFDGSTYEAKAAGTANITVKVTPTDTENYNEVSKIFSVTVKEAPLANIAALSEKTEAGEYDVVLENAVVTYVNGNYAYIQDESGAIVMYKSGHGLTAGDVLNGTATVAYQLRNKNPQITSLENYTATAGTAPEPTTLEASDWKTPIASVLSQYFKVTDATITQENNKYYVQLGDENVQLFKVGSAFSVSDLDAQYTIVGFPTLYNTTLELQIFEDPQIQTYEITAATNNDGWGTAVYENGVITATPTAGYRFATTAYTVTPVDAATVTQDGNEFVVKATANCTVTINFEKIPEHNVVWSVNGEETTTTALEDAAVEFPAAPEAIEGKTFVGWVTEAINGETGEAPAFVTSATMGTADVTYYAVFASQEGSGVPASLTKMTSNDTFATGDKVVIVANDVAMYQETTKSSYVNKYTYDNSVATVAADDKNWLSVSAGSTAGTWKFGDDTNGYVYNSGSNNLAISTDNSTDFSLAWDDTQGKFTLVGNNRWLSYRSDLDNKYFRMGGQTSGNASGDIYFDIYKYNEANIAYSGYCTTVDVPIRISNVEELKAFRDAVNTADKTVTSKNVMLVADLDLSGEENWTPIGNLVAYSGQSFDGVFDGNGHTIKNVTVVDQTPNYAVAGLFGSVVNGTIKNLTVENVNLTSSHYAGGIVAYTSNAPTIENCHVIGGTITSVPEKLGDEYDNGDKVGGIMGYATAGSTINNCTVEGLTIKAYRDMGGIVGYSAGNVTNNTVKNTTIIQSDVNAYKNEEITTYDYIVGRNGGATLENNIYEDLNNVLTIDGAVAKVGETLYRSLAKAVAAAQAGQTITLLDNIDLGNAYANINKAITINGDGHTITSSASAAVEVSGTGDVTISNTKIEATAGRGVQIGNLAHYSGKLTINEGSEITVAKRGINILDVDEGFELNVVNSIIQTNVEDPTTTYTTGEDSRGINFSNDPLAYNANITNTVIRGFSYDVNVYSGTENLTLTMVGGKSYGRDIINNWGKNNTFTLNGVEIHGLNNQTGPTEGFACIVDNEGSEHNTYVINNCQFIAVLSEAAMGEASSSASEYMFALRGTDATVKVIGETTYTVNAPERGGFVENETQLSGNTVYFDETAKGQFENSFVDYKVVATETAPGFIVAAKEYVAQVGDVKYETFGEAVAALTEENNTITLLANIADTYTLAEDQSLNVILGEYTLTVNAPEGFILKTSVADGVTTYSYLAPVAKIGDALYETLQAAVDAATEEDNVVTLLTDINLASDNVSINKAVTIKGEGHTIVSKATQAIAISGAGNVTIDNTVITSQNRGINVLNVTSGFTLNVENSTIQTNVEDPTTTYTTGENSRGINIANADGVTVNISNSTIQGYSYNINIPTSGKNLTVNMTGGKTYGRAAVNNWGSNNTITLDGVEVHGLNNQTGPTEAFACVVDNKGAQNNTFVLKDCQFTGTLSEAALTTEGSTASEHLLQLDGMNAIVKVLGSTTYSCNSDDKSRGGIFYTETYLLSNKLYFDDTTKQTFANAFELSVISDEKEAVVDLYPVSFAPEVLYYWAAESGYQGGYYNFAEPFVEGWLDNGEFIALQKDITLTEDITCQLASGTSFNFLLGDFTADKNGHSVALNTGVTVQTDKKTDIFSAAEAGYMIEEAEVEGGFTYTAVKVEVAAPIVFHDGGTYEEALTVPMIAQAGAEIYYSTDGTNFTKYAQPIEISATTTVTAYAMLLGAKSSEVTKTFTIVAKQAGPSVTDGYYNIKAGDKFVNVAGRKTVTLVENAEGMPGTVIRVKATDGKVETLRSQGVDVPSYAQKAMNYVPEIVRLAVDKLHAEGAGELLGEHGLDAIMEKFDESFDYNLYLEGENNTYRIYGRTPSMKPVVDFYAENKDNVDAKLPQLEKLINQAIDKVLEKTGGRGASILVDFDLETVWQKMGGTLTKPTDEASTAKFYEEVLTSEANVWNFAYQTAMIYWGNLKNNETFKNNLDKLGNYAKYIDKVENIQPNFKYYIVPSESGVDFISEGNIAITDASTAWTMEPVSEFKANFDVELNHTVYSTNGGVQDEYKEYYTTLYTDFAYTVPEGVKAYKVKEISDKGVAVREEIEGTIPAQTPVMLVSSNEGAQALTLSTEDGAAVTGNLLVGADELINQYQLKTSQVESLFNLAKDVIGESAYNEYLSKYEHLMLTNAGTVNNKYFFGLSDEDIAKCVFKNENNEEDCVIRSLSTGDEKVGFYDNWTAGANKAFLISSLNPVKLWLVGDVNRDGDITVTDVTYLVNIILGKATYPKDKDMYDFEAADVDGDETISIADVTKLVNIILGKE